MQEAGSRGGAGNKDRLLVRDIESLRVVKRVLCGKAAYRVSKSQLLRRACSQDGGPEYGIRATG